MRSRLALILPLLLMLAGSSLAQKKEHSVPDELSSSIPLLADFHEVIYPLWHDAWPNKKYDLIKELWPKVEDYSAKIAALQLPGILRDKKGKWDAGVKDLAAVTAKLKTAITANDEKGMLDNVEVLHSTYEKLVRVIRPRLKELEAYHVVLYQIYHYYMPEKNVAKLRKASKELAAASAKLLAVETPKKVQSKAEAFKTAVNALHESTLALQKIAAGKDVDAMATAVEDVHTKYQSVDAMFE
jgi:hypothetical protein